MGEKFGTRSLIFAFTVARIFVWKCVDANHLAASHSGTNERTNDRTNTLRRVARFSIERDRRILPNYSSRNSVGSWRWRSPRTLAFMGRPRVRSSTSNRSHRLDSWGRTSRVSGRLSGAIKRRFRYFRLWWWDFARSLHARKYDTWPFRVTGF